MLLIVKYNLWGMDKYYPYNKRAENAYKDLGITFLLQRNLDVLLKSNLMYDIIERNTA